MDTYRCTYCVFLFFFIMERMLSRIACAIWQDLVVYSFFV